MTLRSMARLTQFASRECAPRHASQNDSPAPTDVPHGALTSRQPPGEDDDGPPLSRKSCQLRLADHAHQPSDICREAKFAVVRSIEIHCSHQYSSRRTSTCAGPQGVARCGLRSTALVVGTQPASRRGLLADELGWSNARPGDNRHRAARISIDCRKLLWSSHRSSPIRGNSMSAPHGHDRQRIAGIDAP